MLREGIIAVLSSFVGTLGFALLMRAPRKALLPAAVAGGLGYLCFWVLNVVLGVEEPLAMLVSALGTAILAECSARKLKMIATIFISLALIPFVPGLGLYRAMHYIAQGQMDLGVSTAVMAMEDILMIALGIVIGSFLVRMVTLTSCRIKACMAKK